MDYLVRGIGEKGKIMVYVARTTELVEKARKIHNATPTAIAALGRALTLVAIMGKMLKGRETISLQILGDGPLGGIFVDADAYGNVRGYVKRPYIDLPPTSEGKLDVSSAVGQKGIISIVRDLGLKEPYRGSTNLVSGGIAKDLAYYFNHSEQQPSVVAAGVYVDKSGEVSSAGGYIVQILPETSIEIIEKLENNITSMDPPSKLILNGISPEEITKKILKDLEGIIFNPEKINYSCRCSRIKAENILLALGIKEIRKLIDKQEITEVKCEFCGNKYQFTSKDLRALISLLENKQ
ncbi:MAG: Hsp33 family molecular chaperone HslO [Dictyoglomaceae bacterium]|nr:Hsp33 family molecular chaperone HslO [Dictyoglomaceae bacterium]